MSANHNQKFEQAVKILNEAKKAGADAVKLQTYTADTMTLSCDKKYFHISKGTIWDGKTLYELYDEAHTPWEWQLKLKKIADDLNLDLFSSPFDQSAVDFLEKIDVPAYKIASFEIVDLPLIEYIAETGKPIIMSTGMATLDEIEEAVHTIKKTGNAKVALLKCTSAYPAPPEEMNLQTIPHMGTTFNAPVGLSDHTLGNVSAISAVALGASIIEKHFTLSRTDSSPDSSFSMEPDEFKIMVNSIRTAEKALGKVSYEATPKQQNSRIFRRSLFVVEDIKSGEALSKKNIRPIRPAHGLHPRFLTDIIGKQAIKDIEKGTPLDWNLIQ